MSSTQWLGVLTSVQKFTQIQESEVVCMKYRKGELFCAVLNCTSRDYSSARSLLEFKPQVITVSSNEKRTPNQLDLVFNNLNMD